MTAILIDTMVRRLMRPKPPGFDYLQERSRMSSRTFKFALQSVLALAAALVVAPAHAQYKGQLANQDKAPEIRSVAVFEWLGEEQHPTRSRIIPITVFDGHQLQDGGIYLAQPQPLALDHEIEYQLKKDGKNTGLFVVYGAAVENGTWVGYGKWQPLPRPKAAAPAQSWKVDDAESDQPVLHRKHKAGDAGSSGSESSGGSPSSPPDPDRPTLHKSADSGSSSTADAGSGTEDPDRPKLKKKSGDDQSSDGDPAVSSVETTDPNRPKLKRGQVSYGGDGGGVTPPELKGLPPEMHQTIAVSDAKNTPEHPWDYSWADPEDQDKSKAQLDDIARTALGLTPPPAPATRKTAPHKSTRTQKAAPPPEPPPLVDEAFRVFELAYGSGATMVLSAHTAGSGANEKFVTLVAQPDLYGNIVVLLKYVTDGAHLDDKPQLRLIDAVDAMADNRGELLFELRGATGRQFALYRVLRGQITRLFVTGGGDSSSAGD